MNLLPLILILLALPAMAGRGLTLQECVDSALVNNPDVKVAALQVERARMMKGTAFNPPMTSVVLQQETTGGGGPENGVVFSQDFDFPTLYVARHKALSAAENLETARFNLLVSEVERDVASVYCNLVYYRHLLALGNELGDLYDEFCKTASARFDLGEAGALEVMNAERVREKNDMENRRLRIEYDSRLVELRRITGCPEAEPAEQPLQVIDYVAPSEEFDFGNSPRGRLAQKEIAAAEKEIAVAKNEFMPGLKIGATVQALIKGFNPYDVERLRFRQGNFMAFEVGISVPLFFGAPMARLKAANAEKQISILNAEAADAQARCEFERLGAVKSSLETRLEYFRTTALPRADEIKRIAEVSYSLGDIDYIEYISNLQTAYELYREYADCVNEYNQSLLEIKGLR